MLSLSPIKNASIIGGSVITLSILVNINPAQAAVVIGFTDEYAPSNWTLTNPVGGSLDTSNAPNSITLVGGDSAIPGDITYTTTAANIGSVSFDWLYTTFDFDPSWDPFFVLNGSIIQLTDNSGPNSQSGSYSFSVNTGDVFGFGINTVDGGFGPGQVTISNFSAPAAVPEPLTLLGAGTALAFGTGFKRKLDKNKKK